MYRLELLKKINKYMYIDRKKLLLFLVVTVLAILPNIAYPFAYKYYIDKVLTQGAIVNLIYVILSFFLIYISKVIFSYLIVYTKNKCLRKSIISLKCTVLDNFLEEDLSYYLENKPSDMKMVIDNDTNAVSLFINNQIVSYATYLLQLLLIGIIMICLNYILFLSCILFFILSFIQTQYLRRKAMAVYETTRKISAQQADKVRDYIYLWREIKCLNIEEKVIEKFNDDMKALAKYTFREKLYEFVNYYFGALNNTLISNFFLYVVGGILIINNHLSISSFLVFTSFYGTFTGIIQSIITDNLELAKNKVGIDRILNVLDREKNTLPKAKLVDQRDFNTIEFRNVNFKYPRSEKPILKNFNKVLDSRSKYIIKGKSGNGKSTLVKLMCKEYGIDSGEILFNGVNIHKINIKNFYGKISCVSKDSKIFNTTILENLLYANKNATLEQLDAACRKAEVYDFVNRLPQKYNTVIGENGIKLSGGERQRLALARAFLRNSLVYILDEATSELATDAEYKILNRIIQENKDSIIIIISHRNINLENMDVINI